MKIYVLLFVAFVQVSTTLSTLWQSTWLLENTQTAALDGAKYVRPVVTVNGTTLGPTISGMIGDSWNITVLNRMASNLTDRATSIHWHGFFMRFNASQDGVSLVTQCPIPPNYDKGYAYHFATSTKGTRGYNQTGTYWYHSHFGDQYCDGFRAPFIIRDPNEPKTLDYDIDDDTTIIHVADWYHKTSKQAFTPGKIEVPPDSILINGKGRYGGDDFSDPSKLPDLEVFKVTPGKKIRFRVINSSCLGAVTLNIDNHKLRIIETDGIQKDFTDPNLAAVDAVDVFPGQRVSFVLETNQNASNYWIRTYPFTAMSSGSNTPDSRCSEDNDDTKGVNLAILRYDDPSVQPIFPNTTCNPSIQSVSEEQYKDLKPTVIEPFDREFNISMRLLSGDLKGHWGLNITDNGVPIATDGSFAPPDVATLLQILQNSAKDPDPTNLTLDIKRNQVVRINITPMSQMYQAHPFHLHGHVFQVVRAANQAAPLQIGQTAPTRDVIPVWSNFSGPITPITIQFKADNAGPWIMHCHIDWHLVNGLAVVFSEDRTGISQWNPIPPAWVQLCDDWADYVNGTNRPQDPIYHYGQAVEELVMGRNGTLELPKQ